MAIYRGGVEYTKVYRAGAEVSNLYRGGVEYFSSGPPLGGATRIGSAAAFGLASPNPGGMTPHNGALYMAAWVSGGPGANLFTLNPTTGVATRVGTATNFGLNPAEDVPGALFSHAGSLFMLGDRTHNLYTVNTTTGVATRVGTATNFGINETAPTGATSHLGVAYLLGRTRGLSTLNTATGVATVVAAFSGAASLHGAASHGGALLALADSQDALFGINPATAAATQVGSVAAGFGVGERQPRALASFDRKLLMVGNTLDALFEINAGPYGPPHTFTITAAGRGQSFGYNGIGGTGAIATGSSRSFNTPVGKWVTVIHARNFNAALYFGLATGAVLADYPSRIVATKTTGGVVERSFTRRAGAVTAVNGGSRITYDAESGSAADVFVNNATIRLDLYY